MLSSPHACAGRGSLLEFFFIPVPGIRIAPQSQLEELGRSVTHDQIGANFLVLLPSFRELGRSTSHRPAGFLLLREYELEDLDQAAAPTAIEKPALSHDPGSSCCDVADLALELCLLGDLLAPPRLELASLLGCLPILFAIDSLPGLSSLRILAAFQVCNLLSIQIVIHNAPFRGYGGMEQ
jgi:hypothetical protein